MTDKNKEAFKALMGLKGLLKIRCAHPFTYTERIKTIKKALERTQVDFIEVDLEESFCELADKDDSAVINHAVFQFYKLLYNKYKNKTIRIVDSEGD